MLDTCWIRYKAPWWCLNSWINVVVLLVKQHISAGRCPKLQRDTMDRPDGGEVSVDWYPSGDLSPNAPVLGILHTITGKQIYESVRGNLYWHGSFSLVGVP